MHITLITPNRERLHPKEKEPARRSANRPIAVRVGECFVFDALYPSKSGLIHKHVVKHGITSRPTTVSTFSSTDP